MGSPIWWSFTGKRGPSQERFSATSSRSRKTFSFFMKPRRRSMTSSGHHVHLKLQALVISMKR